VTAEHVWPQWIAKYVDMPDEPADHYRVQESADGQTVEYRGRRYPFTTTANCVCERCNTGWMSELEVAVEPIIYRAIQGEPVAWHEYRQATVATWALKTAMMIEQSDPPDKRTIPLRIYPMFRWYLRPTTMTAVWTAHYTGAEPHHFGRGLLRAAVMGPEGPVEPDEAEPYAAVLTVGQLAFGIVGHLVKGAAIHEPQTPSVLPKIRRIWPPREARSEWPPDVSLTDEGLPSFVLSLISS
jgi:hypothetical protein